MNLPYKKFKINQLPFRFSYEKIGLPIAVLIISIVFGLLNPVFFSFNNLMNIGRQVAFIGLIAWGQTMIIICGGIDLSVGKMTAFISVIMATIIMHYSSSVFGVIVAIIVSMLLGVLIGYIKGLIIGFLKNTAIYCYTRFLFNTSRKRINLYKRHCNIWIRIRIF